MLLRLVESWKQHLDNGQTVGSVMLDLSKAFDLIPHNLLLDKLATYGISTQSSYLIKNYLCGRRQCVKIAGAKSDTINISRGVPQGSVLGPLFFNIFLNDLFYFVSVAELTNYADDNQISFSHQDPVEVQSVLINELDTASKWFKDCGITLNLDKCKLFVLPESKSSDIKICIDDINVDAIDKVELLGVIIDNKLHFKDHISKIAKKVGKQLDVLSRLKNILSFSSKMYIHKSFIMAHFTYCSSVWYNCLKIDNDKLEKMNERALRYVHNDFSSEYDRLTNKMTLACRRCQDMLIIVLKALTNRWPAYLKSLFKLRDNVKNLRGVNKLIFPKVKTTQHGLKSTVYTASKAWNSLSDELRLMTNIKLFRQGVRKISSFG